MIWEANIAEKANCWQKQMQIEKMLECGPKKTT